MSQTAEFFIENVGRQMTFYDAVNRLAIRNTQVMGKVKKGLITKGMYLVVNGEEYKVREVSYIGKAVSEAREGDSVELILGFFAHDQMASLVNTSIIITEESGNGRKLPTLRNMIRRIYNVPRIKSAVILFSIFVVWFIIMLGIFFFVMSRRSDNQMTWLLGFDLIV